MRFAIAGKYVSLIAIGFRGNCILRGDAKMLAKRGPHLDPFEILLKLYSMVEKKLQSGAEGPKLKMCRFSEEQS